MLPADDGGSGDRSTTLRRYGPLALIVVLLLAVGAVVGIGGGGDDGEDGDAAEAASPDDLEWGDNDVDVEPGAPDPVGRMPITYAEAEEAGEVDDHTWPDSCDPETGRLKMPSHLALPCVPEFEGDNGGATYQGVTEDSIKIVFYAPEQSADLAALLGTMGANDTAEQRTETVEDYMELYTSLSEMYGRELELVRFAASGAANDPVASVSDAQDILAMEPFIVIGGPALDRGAFAQELANAGVICYGCTGSAVPDSMALEMAPYVWNPLPSPNQILDLLDAWVEALGADTETVAELAGGDLQGRARKIGVIHFEQDPPVFEETSRERADMADVAIRESYILDIANLPTKAAELIAQYKAEGITTIVFLGDPIMPIYLTRAATEADYFPEWIFTGTVLTDTNMFGRQYDQEQMVRAFGISQLAAPVDQDLQEYIRLYRWYFGEDTMPPAANQYGVLAPPAVWVAAGLHMAGPDLTPETFARGLFRIPPLGGGATTPQVSFGNWGFFPAYDYQAIDDASEIWWDPDVEAEDERGVMGKGVWRRSNNGARFTADEVPETRLFEEEDTVTVVDELDPADLPPDYPPPEGSPAAGG
ncbi:MAG TPA: hypothetical protein VIL36_16440 [Acidimicrobiales bacterium]